MINKVVLNGRMTADIEMRKTMTGKDVGSFRIAVNRNVKGPDGKAEADFINCVAWGNTANAIDKYSGKGKLVGVEGRIQTRNYENQQGQRVYVTEVIAEHVDILEWKKDERPAQTNAFPTFEDPENTSPTFEEPRIDDDDLPF